MEIDREEFVKIINKYDAFELLSDMLDTFGYLTQTESFVLCYDTNTEEFTILRKDVDDKVVLINWYKFAHVGRCLHLYGIDSFDELERTISDLVVECWYKLDRKEDR